MSMQRILTVAIVALSTSSAALAAPAVIDSGSPQPSSWLTMGCALLLLTTMQRRR